MGFAPGLTVTPNYSVPLSYLCVDLEQKDNTFTKETGCDALATTSC